MNKIDVMEMAKLAKISVSAEELPALERDVEQLIESFDSLPEFDVQKPEIDKVNPMRLRGDKVLPSYTQEEILANTPERSGGCFVIPKTVE